jgi:nitrilase
MRVAAAQARSVWLDKDATTKRVLSLLADAARSEVALLAFPETFLSGYPFWVERTDGARFNSKQQKAAYSAYLDAAVETSGPQIRLVTEAARDFGVFTYLGITERGSGAARGTIYCTLLAIDPAHGIVSSHRKLMPTYEERLVWGTGDGHGLRVHDIGEMRVGGLNCWENWMPQARHALYAGARTCT